MAGEVVEEGFAMRKKEAKISPPAPSPDNYSV